MANFIELFLPENVYISYLFTNVLDGYRIVWKLLSQHISGIIPLSLASVWLSISQLSASLL